MRIVVSTHQGNLYNEEVDYVEKVPEVIVVPDENENKVSNSDIAKAISELSEFELKALSEKISLLAESKKKEAKDVA